MKLALLTLTLLLVATAWGTGSCHGDLVAHWTGDNNAVDATGNGHDGTVNGATYAAGQIGNAFSFDGVNDSVIVAADAALEPANFSISLWVQASADNHIQLLADSTHGTGSAGWALQISLTNARHLHTAMEPGSGSDWNFQCCGRVVPPYCRNLDGSDLRLYIDGSLQTTTSYSGMVLPSGRDIQLGRHLGLSNRALNGLLDDVRIYDSTLSDFQVANLFSGSPVPEPASASLFGIASLVILGIRRRRQT